RQLNQVWPRLDAAATHQAGQSQAPAPASPEVRKRSLCGMASDIEKRSMGEDASGVIGGDERRKTPHAPGATSRCASGTPSPKCPRWAAPVVGPWKEMTGLPGRARRGTPGAPVMLTSRRRPAEGSRRVL